MSSITDKDKIKALTDFQTDIAVLKPLEELTEQVNFFDILKITRTEIRHSNMLAWLLNPSENHGLGDKVLKGLVNLAARQKHEQDASFDLSAITQMDYSSFMIFREWCYIDILAVSQSEKFVLCIENKIDSDEHGNQLERYAQRIDQTYRHYRKLFVYLTPEGRASSDTDRWLTTSYGDILNVIDNALSDAVISAEAELIINNYITAVRRDIMGNDEIKQLCAEIYQKHKKAIDLIIENRPDRREITKEMIFNWADEKARNGIIIFDRKFSKPQYIRFQTEAMSRILPDAKNVKSAWGTHSYYYYEIINVSGYELSMQLAINSRNIPDDIRKTSDTIKQYFHVSEHSYKGSWEYRYPIKTIKQPLPEELSEPEIHIMLDAMLRDVLSSEAELINRLENHKFDT